MSLLHHRRCLSVLVIAVVWRPYIWIGLLIAFLPWQLAQNLQIYMLDLLNPTIHIEIEELNISPCLYFPSGFITLTSAVSPVLLKALCTQRIEAWLYILLSVHFSVLSWSWGAVVRWRVLRYSRQSVSSQFSPNSFQFTISKASGLVCARNGSAWVLLLVTYVKMCR